MANFRHSLTVDLQGNLSRRARQYQRDLGRFTGTGRRQFAVLGRAAAAADRGLGRIENRYVALATGAAAAGAARYVGGLERRFTRLGIQGNRTAEEMESLKGEIFDVANAPGIHIDPSELIAGVERIIEKTGDLDLARENLRNIALVVQAAGAAGADAGAMIADLQEKFGLKDKDEFLKTLDTLVRQGKEGAFTLQKLATQGNKVSAAYASTGRTGAIAAREMGGVLQMIMRGVGSAEQATTAFEALLKSLSNDDVIKGLRRQGIQVFDPDNPKVMRSVATLMKEIVTTAGGDGRLLRQIFTEEEAVRAFRGAIIEFNKTGSIGSLERFLAIQGDGKQLAEDSARAARDAAAAWRYLATSAQRFADTNLAGPVKALADAINDLKPEQLERILDLTKQLVFAAGGLYAARRLFRLQRSAAGLAGRQGVSARNFAAGAAGVGALGAGALLGDASGLAGSALGGIAGFKAGAALGALGGPAAPVTVPLGAVLGGIAGSMLGEEVGRSAGSAIASAGSAIADVLNTRAESPLDRAIADSDERDRHGGIQFEVDINLRGDVPSGTEVRTRSSRPDGRIRVNRVDRGAVMQPAGP